MSNSWIELDLEVLRDNIRRVRASLCPQSGIVFVVKADAYGHGMPPVARCAAGCGVSMFAVAHIDEAILLRSSLPDVRIIILGVLAAGDVPAAVEQRLVPVLVDEEHAASLAARAVEIRASLECHVKIDTGMGRLGIPWERAPEAIERMSRNKSLKITGICSHFASADEPDAAFARTQAERFHSVMSACAKKGITFQFRHISNSGGFHSTPDCDYEGVRCGIQLYGYGRRGAKSRTETRPFLQWKSRVVQVKKVPAGFPIGYGGTFRTARETLIATIDTGYADGYPRLLGNKAQILVGGRRVPVVGRVSMNMITVDLGPASDVKVRDEAVLLGRQGAEAIWADEIAGWCGTIPYEILTGIRAGRPGN